MNRIPARRPPSARTADAGAAPLALYDAKRDFTRTPEPKPGLAAPAPGAAGDAAGKTSALQYVVQKHWASHLHYDFRLEWAGVLLSWAVPKGPSFDPRDKRMAIHVEDHPVAYGGFEGTIPAGQYGAGTVIVWDRGHWLPVGDVAASLSAGKLVFALHGDKLAGLWELVRIAKPGERTEPWILFKKRDGWERPRESFDVVVARPDSVLQQPLGRLADRSGPLTDPATAPEATPTTNVKAAPKTSNVKVAPASNVKAAPTSNVHAASSSDAAAILTPVTPGKVPPTHPKRTRARSPAPPVPETPPPEGRRPSADTAARKASLPDKLSPQLASLGSALPEGDGWVLEPKWDGYRILARTGTGKTPEVRLHTRNGHDWTDKMPTLAAAVAAFAGINAPDAWLDGEIVVLADDGAPDFNALQNGIGSRTGELRIVYFLFDVPFLDGRDLRPLPLSQRRDTLRRLFDALPPGGPAAERVRFSPDFDQAPAGQMLEAACAMRLEGLIAKRADAPYVSQRSDTWLKLKCTQRQEFVVLGYTDRAGASGEVGSLLLGVHEGGVLTFAGSVGTGWDRAAAAALHAALQPLRRKTPTVDPKLVLPGRWGRRTAGAEQWVAPSLVVEASFAEWTPDGHVRHAVFKGIRMDKPADAITREKAMPPAQAEPAAKPASDAEPPPKARRPPKATAKAAPQATSPQVKVSHPERVVDPSTGLTKLDLVRWYESIAERLLPHLVNRPVSLLRAPEGVPGEHFFQKHAEHRFPGITQLPPALWPGHAGLMAIDTLEALLSAAQMNVIELHTWNSTARHIDKPDRVVFDLDPGEGVPWQRVQEGAELTRALLEELGLRAWLKTSGGKGLHVVVPLAPRHTDADVKAFSQAAVQHLAETLPDRFVARSGPANRVGKIFVDWLRNGHGQTTAAAFSARARPGLGVSMPVAWEQLGDLKGGAQWTIATARDYLSFERVDPWADYWTTRQGLAGAKKRLAAASPR